MVNVSKYSIDLGTVLPKPELYIRINTVRYFLEKSLQSPPFGGDQPAVNGRYNLPKYMERLNLG